MCLADVQLTANDVLRAFHRDEPYLFLGAAFTTVGVVCISYCVMRRRFDPLLVWLAIFAHLYGQRLWLNSHILLMTIPNSEFFHRLIAAVDYLVPIPAFLFFRAAGFLGPRHKALIISLVTIFAALVIGTCTFGTLLIFRYINDTVVIVAILAMMAVLLRRGPVDRDFAVMRVGLFSFGVLAVIDNVVPWIKIEPYGFAILLACLGYVAARRTVRRDEELGEIHKELDLARRIQLSLLPPAFPDSATFQLAARYVPMTAVAGDLYEFLVADANHVGLLIADVSGHGVPAALIASMVKMAATSQRPNAAHPALLLAGMNAALCGNTQGQYVTAAYVHLDARSGEMRYAAAGHPAMLLLRDQAVTEVAENGLLLAAVENATYTETAILLEPGDRLLLYTDGVTEARNAEGRLYGEESLFAAFRRTGDLTPAAAADDIIASVQQWGKSQDDDLTVLVCDYAASV